MKTFIKTNSVLILGIMLPLLMIILFGLATIIPKYIIDPPKYDLLFATGYNTYSKNGIRFNVNNGRLSAHYLYDPACSVTHCMNKPILYIFEAKSKRTREVKVTYPKLTASATAFEVEVNLPQLANLVIDTSPVAPDGYQYNNNSSYNGNLFSDLFYSSRSGQPSISKDGNIIVILPDYARYGYYDMKFIGWIIPQQGNES